MSEINMKQLVADALAMGFTDVEIYSERSKRVSFSTYKGELDKYSSSEPMGISVRGIYNGKMGNAYTEKTDEASLRALLEDCLSNAKLSETEETVLLYQPKSPAVPQVYSGKMADPAARVAMVKGLEEAAKACEGFDQLQNQYGDFETEVSIVNNHGLDVQFKSGIGYLYLSPIVKRGEETQNEASMALFTKPEDLDGEKVLAEAIERTALMFGAEILPSGRYETVMSNRAMASLLEVMAGIFSAEAADKGLSAFKDKVGQAVASAMVTLVEDPALDGGIANTPFDSEGVPTFRKALIDQGTLTGFMHNLKTAAKFGVEPTGNGFKANFKSPVGIGGTNIFVENGDLTLDDLLATVGEGIFIHSLDGLHAGINGITGDFSLACRGQQIEGGKLGRAVHQMTVSGNYFDMLLAVKALADDLLFDAMDASAIYGAPSIWVDKLTFAGK